MSHSIFYWPPGSQKISEDESLETTTKVFGEEVSVENTHLTHEVVRVFPHHSSQELQENQ
jgi:hypothetical protein